VSETVYFARACNSVDQRRCATDKGHVTNATLSMDTYIVTT